MNATLSRSLLRMVELIFEAISCVSSVSLTTLAASDRCSSDNADLIPLLAVTNPDNDKRTGY